MTDLPPVHVVGAGWAGLSAAFHLASAGRNVTLHDSAPQAGGRARGLKLSLLGHERELDNGQHLLIGAYTETQAMVVAAHRALGLPQAPMTPVPFRLKQAQGLDFGRIAWADKFAPLRFLPQAGTALGLLLAKGLSLKDKLAFIRLSNQLKTAKFKGFEGITVASLLRNAGQPPALIEQIWEPLCVSALNTGVEQACAQTFVNVLHDSLMVSPASGHAPANPPAAQPGRTRAPPYPSDYLIPGQSLSGYFVDPVLKAIDVLGGRVHLRHTVRDLGELGSGPVVLAVPPGLAAGLLTGQRPELANRLNSFDYQSITTVYLAWEQDLGQCTPHAWPGSALPSPLLLREEPDRQAFGQWLFDRGYAQGIHVAAVVVSARGRYAELDNEGLSSNIARQVSRQTGLPMASGWRAITEKRATFSCTPDRPRLSDNELSIALNADRAPSVFLAGDYCYAPYPATLESAVRSGRIAAQKVLAA